MAQAVFNSPTRTTPTADFGAWGLRASALIYLSVLIITPLFVITVEGLRGGLESLWTSVTRPAALQAVWLSVSTAGVMALINVVMGTLTAVVLARYHFPGKRIFNSLIDLPFAIPTLVTGVMLVLLYGPQTAVGGFLSRELGWKIVFAPPGIILALTFVGYPFVIRAVQPVLEALDTRPQEAAYTLGASEWTTFRRVVLPAIFPAMLTGGLLSFARALGEFGSIVIVAGNVSKTASVYIYGQVENGDMAGASGVSALMLAIALSITFIVSRLNRKAALR
jgi:sulfate transport system permease protein